MSAILRKFSWLGKGRYQLLLLAMLAIGLSLPFVFAGRDVVAALCAMTLTDVATLVAVMFVLIEINAVRVMLLLPTRYEKLTFLALLRLYLAVELFAKSTPAGAGAPLAAMRLIQPYQVPVSLYLSMLMMTAMLDLVWVATLAMMTVVLWGAGALAGGWSFSLIAFLTVMVLLLVVLLLFSWNGWLADFLVRIVFILTRSERGSTAAANALYSLRKALKSMLAMGYQRALGVIVISGCYWLLHLSVLYLVVKILGGDVSWVSLMLIQLLSMTGGYLSMSPGGAGVTDAAALLGLSFFLEASLAASAVLVWRFLMLYLYLLLGGLALAWEVWLQRRS